MSNFKMPDHVGIVAMAPHQATAIGWVPNAPIKHGDKIYTADALRDVLEQAAQLCDATAKQWSAYRDHFKERDGAKGCANAIRALIKDIQ